MICPPLAEGPRSEALRAAAESEPVVRIATRRNELLDAFRLVYQAYLRAGLCEPNPHRMRVTPYHLLPTTEVLVAVSDSNVAATMTLVRDGGLGLPMECVYPEEVAARREQGIELGEVSCLAARQEDLRRAFPLLVRVMSLCAQCARSRGLDELLIAVHPRHAGFYERFLGFQVIGHEKVYDSVCYNPAVPLALDLTRLAIIHPTGHKRLFSVPLPGESLRYRPVPADVRAELEPLTEAWPLDESPTGPEPELMCA